MSLEKAPTLPVPSSKSPPPLNHNLSYPSPASSSGSLGSSHYFNQGSYSQPYTSMEFGSHHLSQSQAPPPHTATTGTGLAHYPSQHVQSSYHHPTTHGTFPQFQYPSQANVSSPHPAPVSAAPAFSAAQVAATLLPMQRSQIASSPSSLVGPSPGQGTQTVGVPPGGNYQPFDTTGQVAPPGMKPRVTATLWEDEGSLCFQVEAKGVCVARREDNHMINGTKLLNVAGMTRGRRDGILKSEKIRHVVKIGPMHLKGVWIPFERALDFANKEKITELLYPLFVHNIGALLYHPTNSHRTTAVMQAAERRRFDPHQRRVDGIVTSSPSQAGPGGMHHPAGMHAPMQHLPSHHAMQGHHNAHLARPGIERSVSFPTPPSSASSMLGIGGTDHQFWNGSSMVPTNQSLTIDTVINSRSMPSTPATTPPSGSLQQLPTYSSNAYESYRLNPPSNLSHQQAQHPTQQAQSTQPGDGQQTTQNQSQQPQHPQDVTQQNLARFGPPASQTQSQYISQVRTTSDMGPPPTSRSQTNNISRPSSRQNDTENKGDALDESQGLVGASVGHEGDNGEQEADHEADHEHEDEYTHASHVQSYGGRAPYYTPVASMAGEHGGHISPELGSSSQASQSGAGNTRSPYVNSNVAVPRTVDAPSAAARNAGNAQTHWASPGYSTPPRGNTQTRYDGSTYQTTSGNDQTHGQDSQTDSSYQVPSGLSLQSSYPSGINGVAGTKRMRDDDDDDHGSRPSSHHGDDSDGAAGIKRRKTGGGLTSSPVIGNLHPGTFERDSGGKLNRRQAPIGVPQQRRR